jgi:hypothetical protein
MMNSLQHKNISVGDTIFAASRQVWLAGLGAAVVTRDWAEKEAGNVLRTLVKEGTAVESRAIRFVGDQVESSVATATVVWKKTRATVETTVRTYADTAVALVQQSLPKALPKIKRPTAIKVNTAPKAKAVRARRSKTVTRAKRGVKTKTKR